MLVKARCLILQTFRNGTENSRIKKLRVCVAQSFLHTLYVFPGADLMYSLESGVKTKNLSNLQSTKKINFKNVYIYSYFYYIFVSKQ